jgi:NADPH-dependent curcumin reductase CurA
MLALCQAGRIRASHHIVKGFENTPDTLGAMLSGRFFGKVLVQYHDGDTPL